jgi:hypothetical protein
MTTAEAVSLKLKKFVDKAVREYNKYRSPESTAKLLRIEGSNVMIKFEGPFCATCGINDWVEDMKFVMEDLGAEVELVKVIEPDEFLPDEDWRIGVFRIRKLPE